MNGGSRLPSFPNGAPFIRLRFLAKHLHELGQRPLYELLKELIERDEGEWVARFLVSRLERWAEFPPFVIKAIGASDLQPVASDITWTFRREGEPEPERPACRARGSRGRFAFCTRQPLTTYDGVDNVRAPRANWDAWFERARSFPILPVAEQLGAQLKNVATNEWAGPCPLCGGDDRFALNVKKNVFLCRGSDARGSPIDMVMHVTGCSVIEAAERINGDPRPDNTRDETPDERDARLHVNAARMADLKRREEDSAAETAKAQRDEQHIDDVLERALPIDQSDKGMAYLQTTRGLRNVPPRFLTDIRYVPELSYWGFRDDGGLDDKPVLLAVLPAVVALIRNDSGAVIGLAETYLGPGEPKKWSPPGYPRNKPVKVRGSKKHGLILLGPTTETLGVAEGWINALSYYPLGFGPEDMSLAAAVDLGNMGGRAIGAVNHPTGKSADGRRARMPQGLRPDPRLARHDPAERRPLADPDRRPRQRNLRHGREDDDRCRAVQSQRP